METMTRLRAAIYARYSTENQKETSIEDQIRVCREHAELLGCHVSLVLSDSAVSGTTLVSSRPGGSELLEAAMTSKFNVLVIEGLDRLSRSLVEQERVVRRLEHHSIRIVGVSDGYDTNDGATGRLARGVRGLINEAYIEDLGAKTRRGLAGQIERGFHAGGHVYGYKSVPDGTNNRGEARGYKLSVNEEHAKVVRRIFAEFAHGASCQHIARGLNADGISAPRSASWGTSVLYGNPQKGVGILNNELYVGRLVWNRSEWTRDPETHRRVRRPRPSEEWIVVERPELRIVDDDTWQLVRDRLNRPRLTAYSATRLPKNKTLLGGLLRCYRCGGPIIAVDKHSYGCAQAKDRGPAICIGVRAPRRLLHSAVLRYIEEELSAGDVQARIEIEAESLVRIANDRLQDKAKRHSKRIRELDAEVKKIVDAIGRVGITPALAERLKTGEAELKEAQTRTMPASYDMHQVSAMVKRQLKNLSAVLESEPGLARSALREALGGSTLVYESGKAYLDVHGCGDRIRVSDAEAGMAA
jgi:DNA invertase Pin-like site-specific DNA recombinase